MSPESADQLCDEAASKLGEHFDSVVILVTWSENGETFISRRGTGNKYAQLGMAHEFINEDFAEGNADQLSDRINKRDSEDE